MAVLRRYRLSVMLVAVMTVLWLLMARVSVAEAVNCPVCGKASDPSVSAFDWKGNQHTSFCSEDHAKEFKASPEAYIASSALSSTPDTADGGEDGMSCPVCGMPVPASTDPHVALDHGQLVHTCSTKHASMVASDPSMFEDSDPGHHETSFCSGGSIMWMGLAFENDICTNLLLDSWTLNTKFKLGLACVGVALLGVFIEYLGSLLPALLRGEHELNVRKMRARSRAAKLSSGGTAVASAPSQCSTHKAPNQATALLRAPGVSSDDTCEPYALDSPFLDPPIPAGYTTVTKSVHKLSFNARRALDSILYGIIKLLANLYMLIAMTYNMWLIISMAVGVALGRLLFFRPTSADDPSLTQCH